MGGSTRAGELRYRACAVAVAACFATYTQANPTGPSVVAGQASFATQGNSLTVTNTPGAIINWRGFSIGAHEITRFQQQNAASTVLNRVTGQDPSVILGQLQSNGRVFLINPSGITFGPGAIIDVAGLVASSLHLSDADFLAGRMRFRGSGGEGAVANRGEIRTPLGGRVFLVAPKVENSGLITTPGGDIILAAGRSIEIVDPANPHVRVEVSAPEDEAINVGTLVAAGGRINMLGGIVRNSGRISADAAVVENERVFLRANVPPAMAPEQRAGGIRLQASYELSIEPGSHISADGPLAGTIELVSGGDLHLKLDTLLSASGIDGGLVTARAEGGTLLSQGTVEARGGDGPGGTVRLLGDRVALLPRSRVDASGEAGGGEVLVGGDYQGKNPDVANASRVYVGPDAEIRADAGVEGSGGKVIVWADRDTEFHGSISAQGGSAAGDGGFVEVSGKEVLTYMGAVDTRAPNGTTGTLLLDPSDITISNAAGASMTANTPFTATAATGTLNVGVLQNTLANTSVLVDTTSNFANAGNITVSNAVTWSSANNLELRAHDNVITNASITASGAGQLKLTADQDGNGTGSVTINAALVAKQGGIQISGSGVTSTAAGTINTTGLASSPAGNINITSTGAVSLLGTLTATGGTAGANTPGGSGGVVTVAANGGLSTAAISASGSAGVGTSQPGGTAGTITLTNSGGGNLTTGALTARAGAGTGTAGGGAAGSITVTNNAAGALLTTGVIDTRGNNNADGGSASLVSQGMLNFSAGATILAGGGTALAGTAGRSGGAVMLSGANVANAGAVTTSGTAGSGANQAGGNAGNITISSSGSVNVSAGALTASGGGAGGGAGSVASGGNAGAVSIVAAGTLNAGAITASTGASMGNAAGGDAGWIALTGTAIGTGALTTTGGGSGAGGNVTANATAGALSVGAIAVGGGAGNTSGAAGGAGGAVVLNAATTVSGTTVVTTGGAGGGMNQAGGAAGAIQVSAANGITLTALTASGGTGGTGSANGGAAGVVALTNSAGGNLVTGTLTASAGAATGTASGGAVGSIMVTNNAGDGAMQLGAIDTRGNNNGAGGNVALSAQGDLSVAGGANSIRTSAGAALAGTAGQAGGAVILSGANVSTTGVITTSGGAGNGLNRAGGSAGSITITSGGAANLAGTLTASGGAAGGGAGSVAPGGNAGVVSILAAGTLNTAAITAQAGASSGSAPAAAAGSIMLQGTTVSALGLTTTGGTSAAGGAITANATTGSLTVTGAIAAGGGAGNASGAAGGAGGTVTLTAAIVLSTSSTITATGGAGGGASQAGGSAGNITISAGGSATLANALTASGGAAGTGNAVGGAAGAITLTNGGTGNLTTGALTARAGAGTGTASGGAAGSITVTSNAGGGAVQLGAIDTRGNNNGDGGNVTVSSQGALSLTGVTNSIAAQGCTALAGTPGRTGGTVSLSGNTVTTAGAITTSGSAGSGATRAGGRAGNITVTSSGAMNVAAGALTAIGGAGGGGNANGGSGGSVTLDAGSSTITIANITTTGGNRTGAGTAGAGGNVVLASPTLLNANTTIVATGGSAGAGVGGSVQFTSTLDSAGASRTLAVNTNANTTLAGNVGSTLALASITTDAAGNTRIGAAITTTGNQTYNDPLALTGNAVLSGATPAFNAANGINGSGFDLTLDFSGNTAINGATFTNINSLATGGGGNTTLTGSVTTAGAQSYNDAVTLVGATTLASTGNQGITFGGTLNGAQPLAINTTGNTTFGGAVGSTAALTSLTTNAGGSTRIAANVSTSGAISFGDNVTLTGASTVSSGGANLAFGGTLDGGFDLAIGGAGTVTFSGAVGNSAALASLSTGDAIIAGGLVSTTGNQAYSGTMALAGTTTLRTAGGNVSAAGVVTATTGNLTLDLGAGNATLDNVANQLGNVAVAGAGAVTLVANGSLGIGTSNVASLFAQARGGDVNLRGTVVATTGGNSIVLVAAQNFVNSAGNTALHPGAGRWLVYSTDPANDTRNLSYDFKQYNAAYGNVIAGAGNGFVYTVAPVLTAALAGTASRVYDGNVTAPVGNLTLGAGGAIDGDSVTLTLTSADYDTKNVGIGKTVTANGIALASATNNGATVYGYQLGSTSASANVGDITARALTIGASGNNRVYDGTTVATVTLSDDRVAGDVLSTSYAAASFGDKNVGVAKPVSVTGLGLAGTDAGNYTFNPTANTTADITARALTIGASGNNRVYDGTTVATVTLSDDRVAGDVLSTSYAAASFGDKNVGVAKPVSVTGLGLAGTDAGNYTFNPTANTTADITARAITATADNQSKIYGDADPALTFSVGGTGLGAGDTVAGVFTGALSRVAGESVTGGPYAIHQGSLAAHTNYALTYVGGQLAITPAPLSVTAQDAARLYGDPNPAFAASYSGFRLADTPAALTGTLQLSTAATPSTLPGTYTISASGVSSGNYTITFIPGTLTISNASTGAPDPLASTLGVFQAPLGFSVESIASLAVPVMTVALLDAGGSLEDFLNSLPASASGPGTEATLTFICSQRTPFDMLRCRLR